MSARRVVPFGVSDPLGRAGAVLVRGPRPARGHLLGPIPCRDLVVGG